MIWKFNPNYLELHGTSVPVHQSLVVLCSQAHQLHMGNYQIDFGDSKDNQQLLSHPVQLLDLSEGRQEKTRASAG
jgi:hypothetical protein